MKTAEEIATQVQADFNQYPDLTVHSLMVAAIEADRAQRQEEIQGVRAGDIVELTGVTWDEWGMRGERVTLTKPDEFNYHDQFWAVFVTDGEDYSVTKVEVL